MNSAEAKRILMAHRESRADVADVEVQSAVEQARRDPVLGQWWKQQMAFHRAMSKAFSAIPVPENLREQIDLRRKVVSVPGWRAPRTWAAAAAVALALGLAAIFLRPGPGGDSFPTFRSRMVGAVLRQYRMDIVTNDMTAIRQYLEDHKAPADYRVPPGSRGLSPAGAGVLAWQASPVSMVCLDSGGKGTVFLFVVDRARVPNAPGSLPELTKVNKLMTASWVEGGMIYILAFQGDAEDLRRFL